MKAVAIQLHKHDYSWVVKIRNTSEAVLRSHYLAITLIVALRALVSMVAKGNIVPLILPPLCFLVRHGFIILNKS